MTKPITLNKIYREHISSKTLGGELIVCTQTTPLKKFIHKWLVHFGKKFGFLNYMPMRETSVEWKITTLPDDYINSVCATIRYLMNYYRLESPWDELVILWGTEEFANFSATGRNYMQFTGYGSRYGEPQRRMFNVEIVCVPYLEGPPLVVLKRDIMRTQ